MITEEVI